MHDVYSIITTVDSAVVAQVADAMEISAADPRHREMVAAYGSLTARKPDQRSELVPLPPVLTRRADPRSRTAR
jgi:hypothetical protein